MDKDIFISVIIPVYNVEKYIRKCINSILEQSYKNYEIILVDDGSTDGSGVICDEYSKKHCIIKTFHKKNGGLSSARNYGIDKSSGNYICFLDSDDWYSDNALEEFIRLINNYNADISIINVFNTIDEKTEYKIENKVSVYNQRESMTMLFNNSSVFGTACNKLYKREIFNNIKFPEGRSWEDMYISLDVLINVSKVAWSQKACLYYRHREGSITSCKFSLRNLDEYYALSHVDETIKKINRMDLWIKNNHRCLNFLMKTFISLQDSDLINKEDIMNNYKTKIIDLFNSMAIFRWRFKDIKRFIYFNISPKLYKYLVLN